MKKPLLLFLFIGFGASGANAQQKGALNINVGAGCSFIGGEITYFLAGGGLSNSYTSPVYNHGPVITYSSPAYNLCADYNITLKSCVGVAGTYQYLIYQPYELIDPSQRPELVGRINIALRYLYLIDINKKKTFTMYVGSRVGISMWQDVVPDGMDPQYSALTPPNPFITWDNLSKKALVMPSFQVLFALKYYIIKNLGLHFEYALGTPYLAEAGITYRLQPKSSDKK